MSALLLAKHATRRLTCLGVQYRIGTHIVTVNAHSIVCSCGLLCENIALVERQEAAYVLEAQQRNQYCSVFAID